MKINIAFSAALLLALTVGLFSYHAEAKEKGKNKARTPHGYDHELQYGNNRQGDDDNDGNDRHDEDDHINDGITIRIDLNDRDIIIGHLREDHRRHCPPGLAKKHNGCLPPGLAKKYEIGHPLPDGIAFFPLPDDLLVLLKPAPHGYQYVQVDKDILLIGEATKKVIDAVTLLSAVGE